MTYSYNQRKKLRRTAKKMASGVPLENGEAKRAEKAQRGER